MSAMTLLPCPFCGSSAEYKCEVEWTHLSASEAQHSGLGVSGGSIRHESHRVYCTNQLNCYAAMSGWSADAAVTLWNRRITQPAQSVDVAREIEVLRHERDHARQRYDLTVKILTGIHALLYPPPHTNVEGVTFVFRSPHVHEQMQSLSDRIRAIPDELDKLTAALQEKGNG